MLARYEPSFTISSISVGVVGWEAKYADMPILLRPTHHSVSGDVAPQQITPVAKVDGSLSPAESCGNTLNSGIALARKSFVESFNPRIRISRLGQKTEWECFSAARHRLLLRYTETPLRR